MDAAGGDDQEENEDGKDDGIQKSGQARFGTADELTGEVKKNYQANGLEVVGSQVWILGPKEGEADREDQKEAVKE